MLNPFVVVEDKIGKLWAVKDMRTGKRTGWHCSKQRMEEKARNENSKVEWNTLAASPEMMEIM